MLTMKNLLPVCSAGSLPKPAWLAQPETLWSPWKLEGEALVEGKQNEEAKQLRRRPSNKKTRGANAEETQKDLKSTEMSDTSGWMK